MTPPTPPSQGLRLGIVGAGGIGRVHADAAVRAGWQVAAVADPNPLRREALAAAHRGAIAVESLEALLAGEAVDAVAIAGPNDLHRPLALAALAAGRHVLLEKPAGLDAAECGEIERAAAKAPGVLQIGLVCRATPVAASARAWIAAGRLGRIYHARAAILRRRGIPGLGGWFTQRDRAGGGPLIDLGVHAIDLLLHLLDGPRPLRASGVTHACFGTPIDRYLCTEMWGGPPDPAGRCDVEEQATALLRFEGGLSMQIDVAWAANLPPGAVKDGIVLLGDRAGLAFEPLGSELRIAGEEGGSLIDLQPHLPPGDAGEIAWRRQYEAFAAAIRGEAAPLATIAECRRVQEIIDAIYRSAAEGREVPLGG
jgi:predicted dehydrogenase